MVAADSPVKVHEITWKLTPEALADTKEDRETLGETAYREDRRAFQAAMVEYFNEGECLSKHGTLVSPCGANETGGKILKVRWGRPGTGRSGGVRMVVVAYCEERLVFVARVIPRKDEPSREDVAAAGELVTPES